ncbi:hypothetical protein ER308_07155 [Egibacter rhizosphaerae]|uniref:Uncharacterized protein n=1 Tax=Egibacter rhizosphaerae TaxID=1670831 RepID=A0A411YDP3_9ACTN|nr:hypothetical protein [Egibacter rhizosphaerae]QBI19343.1 hypothetical protein ER308_07155 [Egibacter rhizosphaerae]
MADAMHWFGRGVEAVVRQDVDLLNDTIRVALLTDDYTPDQANHQFWGDVNADEVSGAGYSSGGEALTGRSLSYGAANLRTVFHADNVAWPDSSVAARWAVAYKDTGAASTSLLLGYVDFGGERETDGTELLIDWDDAGILRSAAEAA